MLVKNIQRLAAERGLSIRQLEASAGLKLSTIYKWGENTPSVDKVKAVADFFGVTVDELLTDHDTDEEAAADGTD